MNQDDFDRFLAWLHPDREEAIKKYNEIYRRLIYICRSHRFTQAEAEEIADETIDRVVQKVPQIADTYTGDPARYCYGVLRNVMKEWGRRPRPPMLVPQPDPRPDPEPRYVCLEHCLKQLPPEDEKLLLDYYTNDGRAKIEWRRRLAAELGISENALRIRLTRLRAKLKDYIDDCLKRSGE